MSAPHDSVQVMARLVDGRSPKAVLVAEIGSGFSAWLPRSQINIEEGGLFLPSGTAHGAKVPGNTLRITLPRWLAEEKGFRSIADRRQGELL